MNTCPLGFSNTPIMNITINLHESIDLLTFSFLVETRVGPCLTELCSEHEYGMHLKQVEMGLLGALISLTRKA